MRSVFNILLCLSALLFCLYPHTIHAEEITGNGIPFMTISPNIYDTSYFATGGPDPDYNRMIDGNNATTHDTWEGDNGIVSLWLFDGFGLQFPSGISGVQRLEWDLQVFDDGGWYNTLNEPVIVQVTTDAAFAGYVLTPGTYPGEDGIWMTVPYTNNYPIDVSGTWFDNPGVPADSTSFVFEIDFPDTIYGIRIIGDGGGIAGADSTGFVAAEELRVFTGDSTTRATGISPANGSIGVVVDTATLTWMPAQEGGTVDPNVVGHFVYLGTDPNGVRVTGSAPLPVGTVSFGPTLDKDTIYYWHVDELLDDGTVIKGYVYSFQTELTLPVINIQPADTFAAAGNDAVFSVAATDPLGGTLSYQWYYDADGFGGGEVLLMDGPDYSGTATEELTVIAMESYDQGYYFCVVDNGSSMTTDMARLIEGRLIAHWTMDGDPNDKADGYAGVETGGPVYEPGKLDESIRLDGVDDFVTLPGGFDDFSAGLTITLWARPTSTGNWARFIDLANGSASDNILFARGGTTNDLVLEIYNGGTGGAVWGAGLLELNVWQMLTGTVDSDGRVTLYKNGVQAATGVTNKPNILYRSSNFIGRSNWFEFDALYAGSMDDIRLYNYPLTAQEVADLYILPDDIDYACIQPIQFDLDGNCRIDLNDFAILAERWMQCGRYPTCITEIP
ncbi:MAG: hypothetical protein JXA82_06975 [Sedimentisphaerales bacterium]|nr:hypothetical protein [Sedimentisphaerales bacterium]